MHLLHTAWCLLLLIPLVGCRATLYEPAPLDDHPPLPANLENNLRKHVQILAGDIGERNCFTPDNYAKAADYIETVFKESGLPIRRQAVVVPDHPRFKCGPMTVHNIEAVLAGTDPGKTVVIGAHYDTKVASRHWKDRGTEPLIGQPGTPGADDNASGVAVLLEIARHLSKTRPQYTIRFVAFANEEPPFFQTDAMGSRVCARALVNEGQDVLAMVSLEMLGCFHETSDEKRIYPVTLLGLPYTFDYVTMLGNVGSRRLMHGCAEVFKHHTNTPARVLPIPHLWRSIAWSDDWAFWEQDIPAFALTDTSYLRNHHLHELTDTPDTLDYGPMADVAWGARFFIQALASGEIKPR